MHGMCRHFNMTLVAWAMKKYKHLRGRKTNTVKLFDSNYLVIPFDFPS